MIALRDHLISGMTYQQAIDWLATECGLAVSKGAVAGFWDFYCSPLLQERRRMAAQKAEIIAKQASSETVDWNTASRDKLEQITFEFLLAESGEVDAAAIARLYKLLQKERAMDLDERKVALLEEKAKKFEELQGVAEGQLSEEEKAERIRKILK